MTILVFGFRTSSAAEVPELLYLGDDGDKAQKISEESDYPRVARAVNPTLLNVKHWSEEASKAFEEEHGEELGKPVVTDIFGHFTVEEAPKEEKISDADLLESLTIDELKAVGETEEIDLTGCKLKQDYIDAILASRSEKAA